MHTYIYIYIYTHNIISCVFTYIRISLSLYIYTHTRYIHIMHIYIYIYIIVHYIVSQPEARAKPSAARARGSTAWARPSYYICSAALSCCQGVVVRVRAATFAAHSTLNLNLKDSPLESTCIPKTGTFQILLKITCSDT